MTCLPLVNNSNIWEILDWWCPFMSGHCQARRTNKSYISLSITSYELTPNQNSQTFLHVVLSVFSKYVICTLDLCILVHTWEFLSFSVFWSMNFWYANCRLEANPALREVFLIKEKGSWRAPKLNESCCVRPQLAALLKEVAIQGPKALYNSTKTEVENLSCTNSEIKINVCILYLWPFMKHLIPFSFLREVFLCSICLSFA